MPKKSKSKTPNTPAVDRAAACSPRCWVRMFKPQFADMVADGRKCQTVRPVPKRPPAAGDTISLRCWDGLPYRSKQRVLRDATITSVKRITIGDDTLTMDGKTLIWWTDQAAMDDFARADGFRDWDDLTDWFCDQHGLPFTGVLLSWSNAEVSQPEGEKKQ